jgi:hypothetical protein
MEYYDDGSVSVKAGDRGGGTYGFEIGAHIKLICKNGLVEAGKLVNIEKDENGHGLVWVLQHLDKSHTLIFNPNDNIVAVKVFKPEPDQEETESSTDDGGVYVDQELEPEEYHRREDLRAAELAELYKQKAHEERKRARELMQSHQPSFLPEVTFGTPKTAKPVSHNPIQETRRRLRRNKRASLGERSSDE